MVLEEGEDDMPDLAVGAERTTGLDADEDIELMLETMLEDEEEEKEIEDETQREDMNDEEQKEEARITEHGLKLAGAGRGSALIGPLSKLPRLADGTIDVDALNAEDRKVYNAYVCQDVIVLLFAIAQMCCFVVCCFDITYKFCMI